MGQIRKINDVYYIEFYARGLLYSQVAGDNYGDAQKLLDSVEKKIASGEALTIARYIEIADFAERFLTEAKKSYSLKTVNRFSMALKHLNIFLSHDFSNIHQLDQLTPAIMESYKAHLLNSNKPIVVNFTILLIREILEYGIKLGFINDNPSLHVRLLPWPKSPERKHGFRYEQAKKLFHQGIGIGKVAQLLRLSDIAKIIYFSNLIPLNREDVYN